MDDNNTPALSGLPDTCEWITVPGGQKFCHVLAEVTSEFTAREPKWKELVEAKVLAALRDLAAARTEGA